jgi:hypothetical protein
MRRGNERHFHNQDLGLVHRRRLIQALRSAVTQIGHQRMADFVGDLDPLQTQIAYLLASQALVGSFQLATALPDDEAHRR